MDPTCRGRLPPPSSLSPPASSISLLPLSLLPPPSPSLHCSPPPSLVLLRHLHQASPTASSSFCRPAAAHKKTRGARGALPRRRTGRRRGVEDATRDGDGGARGGRRRGGRRRGERRRGDDAKFRQPAGVICVLTRSSDEKLLRTRGLEYAVGETFSRGSWLDPRLTVPFSPGRSHDPRLKGWAVAFRFARTPTALVAGRGSRSEERV